MATGCLSDAQVPDIKGLESFAGKWYHTGKWPHEGVDFTGQRVGVIGTGSSAIQSIPIIAKQASHLYVFQRTPNFSMPAQNAPLDPEYERRVKADYADFRRQARESRVGFVTERSGDSALAVPAEEREREYEERWRRGGLGFSAAYTDLLISKEANDTAAEFFREQDPRHRARSGGGRTCCARRLSPRHQAALRRHRLLRHVQPRQRHAGRRPQGPDRGDHPEGRAHGRGRVRGWTTSSSPPASTP